MRIKHTALLAALLATLASASNVNAQSATDSAAPPMSRQQVKIERDEFMRSHQWDVANENWVLKPGFEPPAGVMTRDEVKTARDEFLRNNRWDSTELTWVPLKEGPRDLGALSRDQVRAETLEFVRTHEWDAYDGKWVDRRAVRLPKR